MRARGGRRTRDAYRDTTGHARQPMRRADRRLLELIVTDPLCQPVRTALVRGSSLLVAGAKSHERFSLVTLTIGLVVE